MFILEELSKLYPKWREIVLIHITLIELYKSDHVNPSVEMPLGVKKAQDDKLHGRHQALGVS